MGRRGHPKAKRNGAGLPAPLELFDMMELAMLPSQMLSL